MLAQCANSARRTPAGLETVRCGRPTSLTLPEATGIVRVSMPAALIPYIDPKFPVLIAFVVFAILMGVMIRVATRNPNLYIRPLAGIKAIEEAVGRATEMGRPVIYIPGVDDVNNIQTIYSMVILGKVAEMVAKYGTPLLVPTASAFVTPMAEETVKQAYLNAGVPDNYVPANIRYMSNEQFAFTAATNGMILRERPAASILMGSFYAESLLMAETGFAAGSIQVAGTANIHQLPFFVVACDYTLIGEEFYAATAYLSRQPGLLGTIKAQDYFKVGILAVLVVGLVAETLVQNLGVASLGGITDAQGALRSFLFGFLNF
jgi:hypothetical protein